MLLAALGAEAGEAPDPGWQALLDRRCASQGPYKVSGKEIRCVSFPGSDDPNVLQGWGTSADLGAKEGMADLEEQVPGSPGTHNSS